MLANMSCSLIEHKRINTTLTKAKALKKFIEPLVTKSKNDISSMFNKHTIEDLSFEKIKQKSSNWYTDKTTKRAFMELDGLTETI